jgi:hypothetical protein
MLGAIPIRSSEFQDIAGRAPLGHSVETKAVKPWMRQRWFYCGLYTRCGAKAGAHEGLLYGSCSQQESIEAGDIQSHSS